MIKISKQDLDQVIHYALQFHNEDNAYSCGLDNKQFIAQCYLKGIIRVLNIKDEYEFPKRKDVLPESE